MEMFWILLASFDYFKKYYFKILLYHIKIKYILIYVDNYNF